MLAAARDAILEQRKVAARPRLRIRARDAVATRRARAAPRTAMEPSSRNGRRGSAELAWLGGVLGGVRDSSSHRASRARPSLSSPPSKSVEAALRSHDGRAPQGAHPSLRALKGAHYAVLDESPKPRSDDRAEQPGQARQARPQGVRAARQGDAYAPSEPIDEELHRVRKLGKHAGYAAELTKPLAPRKTALREARRKLPGRHRRTPGSAVAERSSMSSSPTQAVRRRSPQGGSPSASAPGGPRLGLSCRKREDLERAGQQAWS